MVENNQKYWIIGGAVALLGAAFVWSAWNDAEDQDETETNKNQDTVTTTTSEQEKVHSKDDE